MERLSFAGIEQKLHPLREKYISGVFDNRELIDDKDEQIIDDILKVYHNYSDQTSLASGEWSWIQENKQQDYKRLLKEGNKDELIRMYRNFFRNQVSYGIAAPDAEGGTDCRKLVNDILLDVDTWLEFCGNLPLSELNTLKIGNPFGIVIDGAFIMYNSCRHYYHAFMMNTLTETMKHPVFLEIGAGYGGVFYFLNKMKDNFCYIVCDLMETLFTNYYYTKKWAQYTEKEIAIKWAFDGEIKEEDKKNFQLILVPSVSHHNMKTNIDVAYNANSFSEMSYTDICQYFETIKRNNATYIFHQNSNFRLFKNSSRGHLEILSQEFPIPAEYRLVYQAISPWTGAGGRYREYLYQLKG